MQEGQKRVCFEGCGGGGLVDFGQDTGFPYWSIVFGAHVGSLEGGADCDSSLAKASFRSPVVWGWVDSRITLQRCYSIRSLKPTGSRLWDQSRRRKSPGRTLKTPTLHPHFESRLC